MKIQYKAAIAIFSFGIITLLISSVFSDYHSHGIAIKEGLRKIDSIAMGISKHLETHLEDRAAISLTLSSSPIIKHALLASNGEFSLLPNGMRNQKIEQLNRQWIETEDLNDPFIQSHMTNPVANHLKLQQDIFPGMYGEIFLTNRYGVMIATTGKLTTLAHAHKYWWRACYNNGKGRIFFDDRGFDTSVKGYVLGIVVPIKENGDLIGILKCNINIMGSLHHIIEDFSQVGIGTLKIVRSGGLIVIEGGYPPLSTSVPEMIVAKLQTRKTGSVVTQENKKEYLVAYTPIMMTMGSERYGFGGSYESIDHIMGNIGEGWHIVIFYDKTIALESAYQATRKLIYTGLIIAFVSAITALFLAKKLSNPIVKLAAKAKTIGEGNFDTRVGVDSSDELGSLADSFNKMTDNLKNTMASKDELSREIDERKRAETEKEKLIAELQAALSKVKTLSGLFPICSSCKKIRDDSGYWNQIESYIRDHSEAEFSHGICPECAKKLYPDFDIHDD